MALNPDDRNITPFAKADPELATLLAQIGGRIRELRTMQGISMEVLAKFAKLNATSLSRIERGHKNLTVETMLRIARALGIDVEELFLARERSAILPKKKTKGG